jgi:hypothetical protein
MSARPKLPASVEREVRRVLDREARRLLAERLAERMREAERRRRAERRR